MKLFGQAVPKEVVQQILNLSERRESTGAPLVPVMWSSQGVKHYANETQRLMLLAMQIRSEHPNVGVALLKDQEIVFVDPDAVRTVIRKRGRTRIKDWNDLKSAMESAGFDVVGI